MNMCNIPDYLIPKESIKPISIYYWFENGRIHCSAGGSIGYKDEKMIKSEAINLSLSVGIVLQ